MTEANEYDFEKVDDSLKCLKGVLVDSLRTVLHQVHPNLSAEDDALSRVECLCIRLLGMLCAKPPPHTIQDIEDRVARTLPTPIDKWALTEARDTIDKSKKKKLVLPFNQIQNLLQKEVLQYKLDNTVSLFLVAVLEYIAADILNLAGKFVLNIRHQTISQEDIRIALIADRVLMDMFCEKKNIPTIPLPTTPRSSLTYEDVVKELIQDVKQHQRDLHMIIWVFREELAKCVREPRELDLIFPHIFDIYDVTVTLLGALEDVIEMSQEHSQPCVGSCFEELAEAAEFDIYEKYAEDITSEECKDALQNLVNQQDSSKLSSAGHGFKEAVKYYLPKLLLAPIWHAFSYFEYVRSLMDLSPSQEDKEVFEQVQGLLSPLETRVKEHVAKIPKDSSLPYTHLNSRARRQLSVEKTRELLNSVEHFGDKDAIGQSYNEYIREDTLQKLSSGKRITERKVYLFDGVLILCKQIRGRSVNPNSNAFDYRQKERFVMRRVEIIDRCDTDDLRFAFEISPQQNQSIVLVAKSIEHKNGWMADLVMVNTKSMLDRILDSILLDIEKKHPLKLPSPDVYKFAVPDSSDNIILEDKESTGVPLIKGATLCKLVERLTYHIYADPAFVRIFLTTYRSFCTPQNLLQLLIERYDIPEPNVVYEQSNADKDLETDKIHKSSQREDWKRYRKEYVQPVQIRVFNVLRHWVDHHFYDFERDPQLLEQLLIFLETVNGKSMRKWVESVLKIVQRKKEQAENPKQITFAYGNIPPTIEHHLESTEYGINLLTLHPLELARQLTILEFELYKTVKPSELVGSVWTKRDKETTSPNLLRMIKHTTNFTNWIAKSILDAENIEERTAMLNRAIEVMMVLCELNNFNGVLSVVAAMDSAAIYRLKLTFQRLSDRYRNFLEECRELSRDHLRRYQEKLRSINPPCVPFFGMYLTNILHIEEGNRDELPNTELINFSKRRKVAEITGEIQQYQNQPYCLNVDPKIRNFLENLDPFKGMSETAILDSLFAQSEKLEPKHAKAAPKFAKKWPPAILKSPGTKPKRHAHQTSSISTPGTLPFSNKTELHTNSTTSKNNSQNNSMSYNTSEGEQSPTGHNTSMSSAHDFAVFANVNIQGNSASSFSQSQVTLNTMSTSINDFADTISLNSSMLPPELPKRSNSITSLPNNMNCTDVRPILSPRNLDNVTPALRSQPIISPKLLDSVNEERTPPHSANNFTNNNNSNGEPPLISPRMDKLSYQQHQNAAGDASASNFNRSPFQNTSHHRISTSNVRNSSYGGSVYEDGASTSASVYPASPKHTNITSDMHEFGPMPISPHVNVPNAHNFCAMPPPPLPPRRREKQESEAVRLAQIRQAPDAPELPPRDASPPPVPPRLSLTHTSIKKSNTCNIYNEEGLREHSLKLPNTSTIMMRRNSALREGASNDPNASCGSAGTPSTSTLPATKSLDFPDINLANNKFHHQNITSAPPVNRKSSANTSPSFSPGETTPKLPPKPKNSVFSPHNDRTTMFPYPTTNHEQ
ncbi:protein son of sevenless isoform X2 [Contarinia nasturtii]|uniref:protein son of sevenless isoform X2 n=1 Tax=Contarinia nasturtii TaxID=265458 RepID=UPI0012D3C13F|nr:protein son of sevenless isoform X2 [Contarinia nasturtii]